MRKWPAGVKRQRRQHGQHLGLEVGTQPILFSRTELRVVYDMDAYGIERRHDLVVEVTPLLLKHRQGTSANSRKLLGRGHTIGGNSGHARGDLVLQA